MKSSGSVNKSIRRTSSVQKIKPPAKVSVGAGREKVVKSSSWANIFDILKVRISFSPRDLECNQVKIRSMTPDFASTFALPMDHTHDTEENFRLLSTLFGKSTRRDFSFLIESTLLSGSTTMEYVNLYRSDGEVLSCHVTVRAMPSGDPTRECDERWAVMTIRSASSIGNANFIGVGLLGVDRIPLAQLERLIGGEGEDVPEIDQLLLRTNAYNGTSMIY